MAVTYSVSTAFKAIDGVSKAFNNMGRAANRFGNQAEKSFQRANKSSSMLKTFVAGDLIGRGISSITAKIAELPGEFKRVAQRAQALDVSFKTVFGHDATKQMDFVKKTAFGLGLGLEATAEGYQKIAASAKGTNLEGKVTQDLFLGVAKASTALQLTADESGGALRAFSQIISKGKVQAEELRGQLGERIPGAFQIAARAMNMTTSELDKFMSDGKLTAEKFIPAMAKQLEKEFGPAAIEASKSFQAAENRFESTMFLFKKDVGAVALPALARLLDMITEIVEPIGNWFSANQEIIKQNIGGFLDKFINGVKASIPLIKSFAKNLIEWWPVIKTIIKLFILWQVSTLAVSMALKGLAIISMIGKFLQFTKIIFMIIRAKGLWAAAQWALNIALNANPIGLITIGIAALIAIIVVLITNWDKVTNAVKKNAEAFIFLLGPFQMVIRGMLSIVSHWKNVVNAFSEGGMIEGIKALGIALVDFLLSPLKGVLQILSKIPGVGGFAQSALDSVNNLVGNPSVSNEVTTAPIVAPNAASEKSKRELGGNASITVGSSDGSKIENIDNGISGVNIKELGAN